MASGPFSQIPGRGKSSMRPTTVRFSPSTLDVRQFLAGRAERQPAAIDEHGLAVVEDERRQHLHAGDALVAHVVEQELVLRVVVAAQHTRW